MPLSCVEIKRSRQSKVTTGTYLEWIFASSILNTLEHIFIDVCTNSNINVLLLSIIFLKKLYDKMFPFRDFELIDCSHQRQSNRNGKMIFISHEIYKISNNFVAKERIEPQNKNCISVLWLDALKDNNID